MIDFLDFLPLLGKKPGQGANHLYRYIRGESFHKLKEGIRGHFLHGHVEKTLVSREIQILPSRWGHDIAAGRPDPGRGHGIVRLRRLTVVIIIGHGCSFFRFQRGCRAFILAFDKCASILRLLIGDSTTVVDRRRPGVNPTPNTHTGGWWLDETSPTCLSKWSETIAA